MDSGEGPDNPAGSIAKHANRTGPGVQHSGKHGGECLVVKKVKPLITGSPKCQGVADQLQTNFAGDLRNILRVVFNLNCSEPVVMEDEKTFRRHRRRGARFFHQQLEGGNGPQHRGLRDAPTWIPDDQSTMCMSCKTPFTFVRRRHHCRNCGKIFCGRCSSNAVSLPHFGHSKPVRVCNHCFVFQVNPFALQAQI